MSLSTWQKLNDRMTVKVAVTAGETVLDDTAGGAWVVPETREPSVTVTG